MSDDRKKPLWPWIVALLIGLPVLYVASFGPACWIAARAGVGFHGTGDNQIFQLAYWPVGRIVYARVPVAGEVLREYVAAGVPSHVLLQLPGGPDHEGVDWAVVGR